ncbi:hypothetical protein M433DRAFT_176515 [Acidomyces richmondensis BFW]|nr:hypothetical protein M433DRAFT_176515 [Acidomyces richmondensis BFW]
MQIQDCIYDTKFNKYLLTCGQTSIALDKKSMNLQTRKTFVADEEAWYLIWRAAVDALSVYTTRSAHHIKGGLFIKPTNIQVWNPKICKTLESVQNKQDGRVIIIAIRGSDRILKDWTVNLMSSFKAPADFIDDGSNACHYGFLTIAQRMAPEVGKLLGKMLKDEALPKDLSLVYTGHSAGGAVASILYLHMLSTRLKTELTSLRSAFRKIHCITFGAPPLSSRPLCLPLAYSRLGYRFLSFVNEGDIGARADLLYVSSIFKSIILYTLKRPSDTANKYLPLATSSLANGGQIVVIREVQNEPHKIEARLLYGGDLKYVSFGSISMHRMELYQKRVWKLAFDAIMSSITLPIE